MDGIHDMGGMHGFGPIKREKNEPIFHHPWEGRVLGIVRATPVPIPGGMRNAIENMDPGHYLTSSYYEKWLHARIKGLIDSEVLTEEELNERMAFFRDNPDADMPRSENPEGVKRMLEQIYAPRSPRREADIQPKFNIGDRVQTRSMHPAGHTRLPKYARGKHGVVTRFYGIHNFQDATPPGEEVPPQPLYAVRFEARELWGESAETNDALYLDMWENYLKPA